MSDFGTKHPFIIILFFQFDQKKLFAFFKNTCRVNRSKTITRRSFEKICRTTTTAASNAAAGKQTIQQNVNK